MYEVVNAHEFNLEVVVVSGDRDKAGFDSTMRGMPFVAVPFEEKRDSIEKHIPCGGYPTPGVVNAKTGKVIHPDVFEQLTKENIMSWVAMV